MGKFPSTLSWNTEPVVTFAVRFIPSNQPHLAIHLALLSLAEFPDCAELPASPCLTRILCSARHTQEKVPLEMNYVSNWHYAARFSESLKMARLTIRFLVSLI